MTETIQHQPSLTPQVAKTKIEIGLGKAQLSIQQLADLEASLVYNEDNLSDIASAMATLKSAQKRAKEIAQDIKEPALRECQAVDESLRNINSLIDPLVKRVTENYTKIAREIEQRFIQNKREKERVEKIRQGISDNCVLFGKMVAEARTLQDLISVERKINLQKTRKEYAEFLKDAILRFDEILEKVQEQKQLFREQGQSEDLEGALDENRTKVQELVLSRSTSFSGPVEVASEIPAAPKPKRTLWKYEVQDINLLAKKHPELVTLVINKEAVDKFIDAEKAKKKEDSILRDSDSVVVDGLRVYLEKFFV